MDAPVRVGVGVWDTNYSPSIASCSESRANERLNVPRVGERLALPGQHAHPVHRVGVVHSWTMASVRAKSMTVLVQGEIGFHVTVRRLFSSTSGLWSMNRVAAKKRSVRRGPQSLTD